ncbi:hypothetical protein GOP47_0028866 [Adiantum capillus-veneris]|nr:hypothetical protein GOP47_0028866 [Adiantum capillus-veneris]
MASPPDLSTTSDYSPYDDDQVQQLPTLSNKVLIAAIVVIFAITFFILCLHIYGKWLWRLRTGNSNRQAQQERHQAHVASTPIWRNAGLSKAAIASLPTFTYREATMADTNSSQSAGLLECAVCLSEFQENEKGRMLPACKHSFHIECIDMWFYSHSTCPLCRAMVVPTLNTISPFIPSAVPTHEEQASGQEVSSPHDIHIALDTTSSPLSTMRGIDDAADSARMPSPQPSPTHKIEILPSSSSTKHNKRCVPHITIDIPTPHDIRVTSPGCISLPSRRLRYAHVSPHDRPSTSHPPSVESPSIRASLKRIVSMQAGKGNSLLVGGVVASQKET